MMMWQILGIAPTTDAAAIRRAYAQQLKQHRPENDPQGYQQLREAFEQIKAFAVDAQSTAANFAGAVHEKTLPQASPSVGIDETTSRAFAEKKVDAPGMSQPLNTERNTALADYSERLCPVTGKQQAETSDNAKPLNSIRDDACSGESKTLAQSFSEEKVDTSDTTQSLNATQEMAGAANSEKPVQVPDKERVDTSNTTRPLNARCESFSTDDRQKTPPVSDKQPVDISSAGKLFYAVPIWEEQEIDLLADRLIADEVRGIKMLESLWNRVLLAGSLPQQQPFHQQLALALSQRTGLNQGVLENVSARLGWGLEEYDATRVLTLDVLEALETQICATEVERGQQQLANESKTGGLRLRLANRLLRSDRPTAPFWIRLVPGLVTETEQQVQRISNYYPALLDHLNAEIIDFVLQPRLALNWCGIMLFTFWSLLFSRILPAPEVYIGATILMASVVFFWLFVKDAILLGLSRWRGASMQYLALEFAVSTVMAIAGILIFSRMGYELDLIKTTWGPIAQAAVMAIIVLGIYWRNWPQDAWLNRRPGEMLTGIFTGPWRVFESRWRISILLLPLHFALWLAVMLWLVRFISPFWAVI